MQDTLINIINDYGYIGILLLILIENIFPPIPSEVVLLFGGFSTSKTDMKIWLVIVMATLGSVLGAIILYAIGRVLKTERLKSLLGGRFGKITRLKPEHVDKADRWFKKYEKKAVLICRCIPVVRSLISIPAGISEMKIAPFLLLTTLGSAVWNTILVYLGAFFGEAWETGLSYVDIYVKVGIVLIIIAAIVFLLVYYTKHKKNNEQ